MTVKYDNTDRWRHLKHFVDTHDYDPSNLEYLKSWIESFPVPPKESNRYEKVSVNSNRYDSISGVPEVTESDTSDTENRYKNISDYVKEKGLCLSDSPSETNTSDWRDTLPRTKICEICGKEYDSSDPPFSNMWCPKCSYQAMEDLKP